MSDDLWRLAGLALAQWVTLLQEDDLDQEDPPAGMLIAWDKGGVRMHQMPSGEEEVQLANLFARGEGLSRWVLARDRRFDKDGHVVRAITLAIVDGSSSVVEHAFYRVKPMAFFPLSFDNDVTTEQQAELARGILLHPGKEQV